MALRSFSLFTLLTCLLGARAFGLAAPGINPTADAFVSSANPGNNYGAAGALEVSAAGLAKGEFDTFVRFNLASTKTYFDGQFGAGNWTVQSITLQLTASAPNNAIFNTSAAGMFSVLLTQSNAFVEGTGSPNSPDMSAASVNFNNRNNYLGASDQSLGLYTFAGGTSGSTTYTLSLSTGLRADVQAGSDATFYFAAADATVSYLFNSTNFGTAAARPTLIVNAVPEPSAVVWLALAGAAGAAAWQGRRMRGEG